MYSDTDSTDIVVDRSPWWQSVRDRCSDTHHISAALLAAMVGRSVAMEIAKFSMVRDCQLIFFSFYMVQIPLCGFVILC